MNQGSYYAQFPQNDMEQVMQCSFHNETTFGRFLLAYVADNSSIDKLLCSPWLSKDAGFDIQQLVGEENGGKLLKMKLLAYGRLADGLKDFLRQLSTQYE